MRILLIRTESYFCTQFLLLVEIQHTTSIVDEIPKPIAHLLGNSAAFCFVRVLNVANLKQNIAPSNYYARLGKCQSYIICSGHSELSSKNVCYNFVLINVGFTRVAVDFDLGEGCSSHDKASQYFNLHDSN